MGFKGGNVLGTINLNTSTAGVTTIGTGGTGAVNIGNATGNTAVTGTLTTSLGIATTDGSVSVGTTSNNASSNTVSFRKSRSGGVITSGDSLGQIQFDGYDSTQYVVGAAITAESSGTIGIGRIASNLALWTHPDSATALTQRLTIASTGEVTIATPDSGTGLTVSGGGVTVTTGAVNINSGTSAFNLSTDASATTVNIATGGAVKTTTLGSTNTTSATLIKGGTGASSFQPTSTGTLALGTTSTGAVSLGNTTGTTSIQFGTGSALSTFTDWASWTPTLTGGTIAGTTTYTKQVGTYMRIGNMAVVQFRVTYSAATGTGNMAIGTLPLTINSLTDYIVTGSVVVNGVTAWGAGVTSLSLFGSPSGTALQILGCGTAGAVGFIQMANVAMDVYGSVTYRI